MAVDSSQTATAVLTEHLQYTPLALIDDIINMVNHFFYQGVSSLENGMFSTPPERLGFKARRPDEPTEADGESALEYADAKQEIEEGLQKLETLLESTVDKNFDKFEIWVLRNVLSVPADLANWIRLNHYENLPYPIPENAPTAESVQLLRRKVAASQTVSHALENEYARNEAILAQLRNITSDVLSSVVSQKETGARLSFLTNSSTARAFQISCDNSQHPLTTNTNFTLSQLPALREILADLRPRLASLQATSLSVDGAKDERREERREYIEKRTKAHLERNGHAVSMNAEIPTGRKMDREEIDALEKVASIFAPP